MTCSFSSSLSAVFTSTEAVLVAVAAEVSVAAISSTGEPSETNAIVYADVACAALSSCRTASVAMIRVRTSAVLPSGRDRYGFRLAGVLVVPESDVGGSTTKAALAWNVGPMVACTPTPARPVRTIPMNRIYQRRTRTAMKSEKYTRAPCPPARVSIAPTPDQIQDTRPSSEREECRGFS